MKKKTLLIIAISMLIFAIGFIVYALNHPEASFPFSLGITYTIYFVYLISMITFFVLAKVKR